jgi:riboflavin synthase
VFTGIVRERGKVVAAPRRRGGGRRLGIAASAELAGSLAIGDSLAVAGVCLTVAGRERSTVGLDLAPETLRRTTLGRLRAGAAVNLEPALRVGEALGGHLVQGHVDGVVEVLAVRPLVAHREVALSLPPALARWVVEKGSGALDGVSLTVASLGADRFGVALVPHTLAVTTLGALAVGDAVNFEADVLAKYVERAVAAWRPASP